MTQPNTIILHNPTARRWLKFSQPVETHAAHTLAEVRPVLQTVEARTRAGYYAAGFVAYEASPAFDGALKNHPPGRFPLAWFGIYPHAEPFHPPDTAPPTLPPLDWQPNLTEATYQQAIRRIRAYIQAGDTYQVNYAFRLRTPLTIAPWALFQQLIWAQGANYGAFVDLGDWVICSGSPEMFFERHGETLTSRPMKGTVGRGLWRADDLAQAQWLRHSEKNRAENVMIVDMVRNDLGRIATVGSVQVPHLFALEQYPTLWQMTSTVTAHSTASLADTFAALFPPASITGAPKARAMQIIHELEDSPRHIYTGSIGYITPQGDAQFSVAIRTVLINRQQQQAEYGVGSGIVWDSHDRSEFAECRTKAVILTQPPPDFSILEALLWQPQHGYFLLDYHLQRLTESAAYFAYPMERAAIAQQLTALADTLPPQPHKIRLILTRHGEVTLEAQLLNPLPQPYRVTVARSPIDASNRFLYHKTTQRQVYNQARQNHPDYDDVLLWNEAGHLTESCMANLVIQRGEQWLTPPVSSGLLNGTYRAALLDQGRLIEHPLTVDDLQTCDAIYLINSVRKRWQITVELPAHQPNKKG